MPELIEEDDFWYNYFYRIECLKASLGLPNSLGPLIDQSKRRIPDQESNPIPHPQQQVHQPKKSSKQKQTSKSKPEEIELQ